MITKTDLQIKQPPVAINPLKMLRRVKLIRNILINEVKHAKATYNVPLARLAMPGNKSALELYKIFENIEVFDYINSDDYLQQTDEDGITLYLKQYTKEAIRI